MRVSGARLQTVVEMKMPESDIKLAQFGALAMGPDPFRYEDHFGFGTLTRDDHLIRVGVNAAVTADVLSLFDEKGCTVPLDEYREARLAGQAAFASKATIESLGALPLCEISTEPPPPMLLDRLDPSGHTILYGTGGIGKGTYTSYLITQLVRAGHHVLILDYEDHREEWARRVYGLGGRDATAGVTYVAPSSKSWQGARGAIWDQEEDLAKLAIECGATFLVIDSIVMACTGTDVATGDTKAPQKYSDVVNRIGVPALSLGHISRSQNGMTYPFGPIFWHNTARVTWSMEPANDGISIKLQNRKHNNYQAQPTYVVTVEWFNNLPREVREQRQTVVLADLIDEALEENRLTEEELLATLNADLPEDTKPHTKNSINKALNRGTKPEHLRFEKVGDKWQRTVS
jgi:hypothetical protein